MIDRRKYLRRVDYERRLIKDILCYTTLMALLVLLTSWLMTSHISAPVEPPTNSYGKYMDFIERDKAWRNTL